MYYRGMLLWKGGTSQDFIPIRKSMFLEVYMKQCLTSKYGQRRQWQYAVLSLKRIPG